MAVYLSPVAIPIIIADKNNRNVLFFDGSLKRLSKYRYREMRTIFETWISFQSTLIVKRRRGVKNVKMRFIEIA